MCYTESCELIMIVNRLSHVRYSNCELLIEFISFGKTFRSITYLYYVPYRKVDFITKNKVVKLFFFLFFFPFFLIKKK